MRIIITFMFLAFFSTGLNSKEINVAIGGHAPMFIDKGNVLDSEGFDVDVIKAIAEDMGVTVRYTKEEFSDVLRTVSCDTCGIDVGVAAITINSEREKYLDFTHPYKKSGLSILVRDEPSMDILGALSAVFTGELKSVWIFFIVFIVIVGPIVRIIERKTHKGESGFNKMGDGMWWTIVTSTTVGYGDMAPKTAAGRIIACIVMLVGICTTGILIGAFSAVFNTQIVKYDINGPEDLKGVRVATMAGTTSVNALVKIGANVTETDTLKESILLLEAKRVDALVFDDPIAKHIAKENDSLTVVGNMFDLQDYGLIVRNGNNQLRESLNRSIMKLIEKGKISELEVKWFGSK